MTTGSGSPSSGVWISAAIIIALLAFRVLRMSRSWGQTQSLKLSTLWIAPLLYLVLAALLIAVQPPHGIEWLWLAAGAGLGGTLGWWRGKTIEIAVHSGTGALTTRSSPAALLFLVGLLVVRYALRYLLVGQAGALHLTVNILTGTFVAFALGLLVMQRVEMTLRANRLLRATLTAAPKAPGAAPIPAPDVVAGSVPAAGALLRMKLSNAQMMLLAAAVFVVVVIVGLALPR